MGNSHASSRTIKLHLKERYKAEEQALLPYGRQKQDRHCTYNLTLRRVRVAIVTAEKQ